MRKLTFALFALLITLPAFAGECVRKQDVLQNKNGNALVGAQIRICTKASSGSPCLPLAPIYAEATCTSGQSQPLYTDSTGTYWFYAAPGSYRMQATTAGATRDYADYVVSPADTAPGEWTLQAFRDDGSTSGTVGSFVTSRPFRITGLHVRATKPWMTCAVGGVATLSGRSQTTSESEHVFTSLTVQNQIKPVGQGVLSYVVNADTSNLSVAIDAGEELRLAWTPASGCSQYGDGVLISVNYEGVR